MIKQGCLVDASITHSPRKPGTKPAHGVVNDRKERGGEPDLRAARCAVIEVIQPGVSSKARRD